jgi:putative IMPACT (imprinted ancient) family translation regulator
LIGHGPSVTAHCSDAGEPSGTAGRPALSVLQGSGLGDVVMVITRYYGGTKLGTGGLVKAYSEAARLAVLAVPKARKVPVYEGMLRCHYQFYERIVHLINGCEGKVLKEEFAELVSIAYSIPASCFDKFQRNVDGMSSGQIKLSITDRDKIDLVAVQ